MPAIARSRRSAAALIAAATLAGGCVPLPGNRQLSRELVARKEGENTLVSDQGATCRVRADTFDKVNVGDQHACVWRYTDDDTTPPGGGSAGSGPVQNQAPRRAPGRPNGA